MHQDTLIWINAVFMATNVVLFLWTRLEGAVNSKYYDTNVRATICINAHFDRLQALATEYAQASATLKACAENLNRSIQLPQLSDIPVGYKLEMTPDGLRIHEGSQ